MPSSTRRSTIIPKLIQPDVPAGLVLNMEVKTKHSSTRSTHATFPSRLPMHNAQQPATAWLRNASHGTTPIPNGGSYGIYSQPHNEIYNSDIAAAAFMWKCEKNGHGRTKRIYTDWANHYLEKARCKRHIQDLQVDVTDGVILSDVVEAVTNLKVPDVVRKPKNASQMLDNIQACLVFLAGLGVSLEGTTARDIRDGHLKSILSLFFQLSRYKQQQKQQDRDRHNLQKQSFEMQSVAVKTSSLKHPHESSKLPSPLSNKHGGNGSSIPLPGSIAAPSSNGSVFLGPKKGSGTAEKTSKPGFGIGNPAPAHLYPSGGSVKPASGSSSRSTSPSAVSGIPQSFIPTPRTSIPSAPSSLRSSVHEKQQHVNNAKNSSGQVSSKSAGRVQNNNSVNAGHLNSAPNIVVNGKGSANTSMLEKFKFFKDKDKGDKLKSSEGSKRTSSSSGFSSASARSERSESSVSLSNESRGGIIDGPSRESLQHGSLVQSSSILSPGPEPSPTPKLGIKGFRQKLGKAIASKESKSSPKTSRKESLSSSDQHFIQATPASKAQSSKIQSLAGKADGSQLSLHSGESVVKKATLVSAPEASRTGGSKVEQSKIRPPPRTMDNSTSPPDPAPTNGNPSFLRHPKPTSANSSNRDSRNRYSGTGIPTRNSIISQNMNNNSSSRDELSTEPLSSATNGTGIPKPTAAVKGTTKPIVPKEEKSLSTAKKVGALQPAKPGFQVNNKSASESLCGSDTELNLNNKNDGISVAMVSPMPVTSSTTAGIANATISSISSIESALSQSNSNSSDSSVIMSSVIHVNGNEGLNKPSSDSSETLSTSSIKTCSSNGTINANNPVANTNYANSQVVSGKCGSGSSSGINEVIVECDEDEIMLNVTPMEPLEPILRSSPYGYMKSPPGSGYLSPKSNGPGSGVQMGRLGLPHLENGSPTSRQGFSSSQYQESIRLISRNQRVPSGKYGVSTQYTSNMGDYDYPEIDNLDITGAGYLSDGDLLMSGNNGNRSNDGYLSESGTSGYARRSNQQNGTRPKETQSTGRSNKHFLIMEDRSQVFDSNGPDLLRFGGGSRTSKPRSAGLKGRFDDSSSLSSGISDLNEIPTDLTSSSVNSELSSPYASLQRPGEESFEKKREPIDPQSIIYRVVGCRSGNSSRRQLESSPQPSSLDSPDTRSPKHGIVLLAGPPPRPDSNGAQRGSPKPQVTSNGVQSHPPIQPSSSSTGKSQGKPLNSLDVNKKKGMMGIKDEYYGKEMAERMVKDERHRTNGHHNGSSGSSDGSGSKRSGKSGTPLSFGYARRSTGSGNSSGGNGVSMTKYSIPVNGKLQEEYKGAHVSLMSKEEQASIMNGGNIGMGIHYIPAPANSTGSPKVRTKVKVSGGTQTTNDLHEMNRHHHQHQHLHHHHMLPQQPQLQHHNSANDVEYASSTCSRNSGSYSTQSAPYKSLSLTTPTATQLSQSLRERILGSQSLPKGATSSADYAAILASIQHQQHLNSQVYGTPNASKDRMSRYNKMIMNDGSMSDTGGYANYADIQGYAHLHSNTGTGGSAYPWTRHSTGYASSITSAPTRLIGAGGSMTEAESLESLSSTSSLAAQLRDRDARSNSLTQGRVPAQQQPRETSPRLNRSNSISSHFRERTFPRSTKSEKLYPSMLQRTEDASPYYAATISGGGSTNMPTSPMHSAAARLGVGGQGPYSSPHSNNHNVRLSMSPYTGFLAKIATKEDEINGSSLSLVSTASSIYSTQEEKHAQELKKIKRELHENQDKVQTLTNQLSTNAHVVAAFEQSLSNMTHRLQNLTLTAEQKDSELNELRRTIELLRKQSIEAGLTVANLSSGISRDGSPIARQLSADSVSSINSISSACSGTSHSHTSSPSGQVQMTPLGTPTHHGTLITAPDSPNSRKKHSKNKGWLRSSFTKAFSRSKSKTRNGSITDMNYEDSNRRPSNLNGDSPQHHYAQHGHQLSLKQYENSAPASPLLASPHGGNSSGHSNGCGSSSGSHSPHSNGRVKGSGSFSALTEDGDSDKHKSVDDLKKQLREKEMVLTDIRLEALTSAHQLESLKETVNKMRNEMLSLKQDNDRLQRMVTYKSLNSSQTSLQTSALETLDRRLSASEVPPPTGIDMLLADPSEKEGKRIVVTVYLGCHGSHDRYVNPGDGFFASECAVGTVAVSSRTKWDLLDSVVRRTFKDYVMRVDPVSNLGLSADSILSYNVGEIMRSKETQLPELLPCGYLVGDVNKIRVCLKGALQNGSVDALAFETLIPKPILQRYVSLLSEYGRLILCGPSGTGKSYLARKLGEFVVARSGKEPCPEAIATFSADHKNSKELRLYLSNLAEQSESGSVDLPAVIILDNLHQVQSFSEVFNGFLHSKQSSSKPLIIGTMTQSTTNVQLHHSFRWVLFGNNTEPTKGLLSRYLQRRLVEADIQSGTKNVELARIMEWVPEAWLHINKFLEKHNSSDVTIGPRLFLSCPTDVANSQVWFTDLWHYSIIPYLIEAVKEGLQLFGKKAQWEDPSQFLLQSYPWNESHTMATTKSSILRLRPEDVGYDVKSGPTNSATKSNPNDGSEPDPLLNMLMRLQEAANYTDPQSNDSDSTSLDSKDFTATA